MNKLLNIFKSDTFKKCVIWFLMYAMIGWIYEVFLEVVVYKWGFSNRGVLFGPYCPVYGFGAMAFIFIINPLLRNKKLLHKLLLIPVIFLLCGLVATGIELITSYLCELFMGSWPWQTYARDYVIHFQGRIALSPSIRFGLGGTVFLYCLQPLFEKFVSIFSSKKLSIISVCIIICLVVDFILTIIL